MARIIRPGRASSASAAVAVCALLAHGAASGSAVNPEEIDPTLERDERGMSPFNPVPARTPSGFLYEGPYARGTPWRLGEEWKYRFSTELGVLSGSGGAVRNYADYREGFVLSHLGFAMERSANYLDFTAAAAGRKDQSYRASFGGTASFVPTCSSTTYRKCLRTRHAPCSAASAAEISPLLRDSPRGTTPRRKSRLHCSRRLPSSWASRARSQGSTST